MEEGSVPSILDFKLMLPVSKFLLVSSPESRGLPDILASGELQASANTIVNAEEVVNFSNLIAKVCFHLHLSVVEQIETNASLYARSIQNHQVALLIKLAVSELLKTQLLLNFPLSRS